MLPVGLENYTRQQQQVLRKRFSLGDTAADVAAVFVCPSVDCCAGTSVAPALERFGDSVTARSGYTKQMACPSYGI